MEQQWPVALQVAVYTASGAMVLLAIVVVQMARRIGQQLDRVVTTVEKFEAGLTPLARGARVVVDRVGDLSADARRLTAVAGGLLTPVVVVNRAARIVQAGATTFLRALWTGRQTSRRDGRTS